MKMDRLLGDLVQTFIVLILPNIGTDFQNVSPGFGAVNLSLY